MNKTTKKAIEEKVQRDMVIDNLKRLLKNMEAADKGVIVQMYKSEFNGFLNASIIMKAITPTERDAFLADMYRIDNSKIGVAYM